MTAVLRHLGLLDDGRRRAARAAKTHFRALHPGVRVAWTDTAAVEPDRFVVGVYYGDRRPRDCEFYAVDRTTFAPQRIADSQYVQRGQR